MKKETSSERSTVDFWVREMNACMNRNRTPLESYLQYVRWYQGNTQDVIDPDATPGLDYKFQQNLDNMTPFVTDAAIADLFFRNPTAVVQPPNGMQQGVFSAGLARVETVQLRDTIEQIGYFTRKRRQILDARLGLYGILKFTYDVDMVVDMEAIEAERLVAQVESQNFLMGDPGAFDAREDQIHSVHIEEHGRVLADAERGLIKLPTNAIKYLRKHIRKHEKMRTSERPTEMVRDAAVVCRRINPTKFFYDITVDDFDEARWVGTEFLRRKADVIHDNRYDKKARAAVDEATDMWIRNGIMSPAGIISPGSFNNSDVMVRIHEVVDLVDGVVRYFAEGGQTMLAEMDFTMRDVQPHGPYNLLVFRQDPQDAAGIPLPTAWASEQAAATALASVNVAAAQLNLPKILCDEGVISAEMATKIANAPTGEFIPIPNVPTDKKLEESFAASPTHVLDPSNLLVLADVRNKINQLSMRGGQRNLSGDRSGSATEAAIVSGASDSISEDHAAIVDRSMVDDFKMIVRLTRTCVPKANIIENCGDEAMVVYPDLWSMRDIKNDRGVSLIPGSSRRRTTDVQSKLAIDGLTAAMALPAMALPEGQMIGIEILDRWFSDQGFAALPWDLLRQALMMQQMMQQEQAMGGGAPDGGPPGETAAGAGGQSPRPSEMNEPSRASQAQGAANIGGGRIATGASRGDVKNILRGKAGAA